MESHGFFTIATDDEQYYKMAHNLLRSYRHFTKNPLPFAILCDRENEYTSGFDDVRIIPNAHRSYLDKLEVFDRLPYDINIFIDSDCIAYGDLNRLFGLFEEADDFFAASEGLCLLMTKPAGLNTKILASFGQKWIMLWACTAEYITYAKPKRQSWFWTMQKGSPKNIRNTNSRANLPRREMNLSWRFPWQ